MPDSSARTAPLLVLGTPRSETPSAHRSPALHARRAPLVRRRGSLAAAVAEPLRDPLLTARAVLRVLVACAVEAELAIERRPAAAVRAEVLVRSSLAGDVRPVRRVALHALVAALAERPDLAWHLAAAPAAPRLLRGLERRAIVGARPLRAVDAGLLPGAGGAPASWRARYAETLRSRLATLRARPRRLTLATRGRTWGGRESTSDVEGERSGRGHGVEAHEALLSASIAFAIVNTAVSLNGLPARVV